VYKKWLLGISIVNFNAAFPTSKNPLPLSPSPPLPLLTGCSCLQLGGVTSIEGIYRSVREGAPTLKMTNL